MPKDVNNVESANANKIFDIPLHLQPGQVNTLAFSQDSISSMQLTAKGELEISFRDGSKVAIADFNELADSAKSCGRDTLIQLSDNTIIYPDQLRDQLSQNGGVDFTAQTAGIFTLEEPKAGQIVTKNIEPGHEYKLGFSLDGVNAAQSGHNLLLTFKDGGVLVLNNYFTAVNSDLPPAMTLADGATIDSNALLTSCKLVEVPNAAEAVLASNDQLQSGLRQGAAVSEAAAPDVEPAAGEEASTARAAARDTAQASNAADVANIEPAAGEGVGPVSGSGRGYGFGSSIDPASFNGNDPIGAIAPTALNYTAPRIESPYVYGTADHTPELGAAVNKVDETNLGSANGVVDVDYGRDGPGALTLNASFSSQYALTSHGVPVTVTLVNGVYTGTANGKPVFTLTLDPVTGAYTFTQLAPLDHANPNNPDDSVGLVFGVTATDADGDTSTTTITINVHDDGPVAVDDGAYVAENALTVSGNVLTNDDAGTDGLGRVTTVTFNNVDVAVPAAGTVSVVGTYGTLVIAADGSYTYTSSNTALGTDKFTYTMVDYDGDSSKANLLLEVRDLDTVPLVANAETVLDETGVGPDGTESATGVISVEYYGDGPGKIDPTGTFSSGGSQKAGALTSHGVPVTVALVNGVYTGTANGKPVFTLTINADGTYNYTQTGALDHADGTNPNDVITLNFGFKATDKDGDSANGIVIVKVLDDAPVAVDDDAYVGDNQLSVTSNVLTNDKSGVDGLGHVTSVSFNGQAYNVPSTGTVTVQGTYGNLVIGANGQFQYTSNNTALGTDKFTYTMVDYDGDPSSAILTLEVRDLDNCPIVGNAESTLDETGVAPDGTETVTGKVTVDWMGDGVGTVDPSGSFAAGGSLKNSALTSNGVPVTVTMNGDVYTGKAGDKVVFTLTLNNDGSYTYTQVGQLDHADGNNPNDVINLQFGFTATDADGDKANGIITVKVLDDAPIARDDGHTNVTKPVTGNVLTNDYQGTDAPAKVVKVTLGSTEYTVAATGSTTINGEHGVLVIKADGSYTYSPADKGTDSFTYTIVDQDGDKSSAKLGFDVKDNVVIDLTVNNNEAGICVKEDTHATIPVTANVTGGDGNEIVTLTLTGVASNWGFSAQGWTQVSPGTYQITLPAGQTNYSGSFKFTPPANSDVDLTGMKVTASVFDPDMSSTKTDQGNFSVYVDAVADVPLLNISLPSYQNTDPYTVAFTPNYNYKFYGHGEGYAFNISATPSDKDGSEKITHYTIEMHSSLAALGVKFSAGTEVSPGMWRIEAGQEVGLKIIFPDIEGPDGNPWTHPAYNQMQGIHTMNVTAYVEEVNLSGNECDLTDNTNLLCIPVRVVILSSPLVIDLNGDGIGLTDADHGVYFDINGDGIADKTGWVDTNDGLLALDKNHNGSIDGQSELFGGSIEDGYAVLARYDDNKDGVIDNNDAVWKDLVVWKDANHDGITDNGELISVDTLDFSSISLDAKATDYQVAGNSISAESAIANHDGSTTQMVDAWFQFYNGSDAAQMAEAKANEDQIAKEAIAIKEAPLTEVAPVIDQPVLISDFDSTTDKIDLSSLIDCATCDVTNAINDFVFSRTENGNTIISVDASGSGSASAAVDVVVLKDVSIQQVDDIVQINHQQQQQSGFGTV